MIWNWPGGWCGGSLPAPVKTGPSGWGFIGWWVGSGSRGRILLDLVVDKFVSLTAGAESNGCYNRAFFEVQIKIIGLLLEHKLYMQAYTVMREFVAALVMIWFEREPMNNQKRKSRRLRYGEVFFIMFQYSEWNFEGTGETMRLCLMPFYEELRACGIETTLRSFSEQLADYRNGFDHAWTAKTCKTDISDVGADIHSKLQVVLSLLIENNILQETP